MTVRLILGCALLMMMAACSKCGGSKAKEEFIAKLDARCAAGLQEAIAMTKQAGAAEGQDDIGAVAQLMQKAQTMKKALGAELKAMPAPADDAASLQAFWAENDAADALAEKSIQAMMHMAEINKQIAEAAQPAEGGEAPEGEEAAPAEQQGPDPEAAKAAEAAVMSTQQEMVAQLAKVEAAARKYGFKVCGIQQPKK